MQITLRYNYKLVLCTAKYTSSSELNKSEYFISSSLSDQSMLSSSFIIGDVSAYKPPTKFKILLLISGDMIFSQYHHLLQKRGVHLLSLPCFLLLQDTKQM